MLAEDINKEVGHNYSQAFFEVFLFVNILVWLPSKFLAYLAPFIGTFWFIIRSRSGKTLLNAGIVLASYSILVFFYWLWYKWHGTPFVLQNTMIFLITYGSFFYFLIIPKHCLISQISQSKYISIIKWFIFIESVLGIFQAVAFVIINSGNFDSATGDVVQGTLSPFSFLNPEGNFNNQIYTANLLVLLLFYLPHVIETRKGIVIAVLGFVAILLASVMHLLIAFLVAVSIITLIFSSSFIKISGSKLIILIFIISSVVATVFLQPKNFSLIGYYFERALKNDSPKTEATIVSLTKMPNEYPWVYFIGLGPGQYCSRAGLIGTGHYFGSFSKPREIPILSSEMSPALKSYIYTSWKEVSTNVPKYGNSTMSRPFYSILSLLAEFGVVFFIVLLFYIRGSLKQLKRLNKKFILINSNNLSFNSIACASLILFFVFISFFENYLEVTQAIFPGLILFKYYYTFLKEEGKTALL